MATNLSVELADDAGGAFPTGSDPRDGMPRSVMLDVHFEERVPVPGARDPATVEIVPRTARVSASPGRPTTVALGTPNGETAAVALLRSDGSTAALRFVRLEGETVKHVVTREDVQRLFAGEEAPPTTTTARQERQAQFVAIGSVQPDFGRSQVAVHVVDSAAELAEGGVLRALGFAADRTSSLELTSELGAPLGGLAWVDAHLGVDGRFVVRVDRPLGADGALAPAAGWVWWLRGPRALAGFVRDDLVLRQRGPLLIALPALAPSPPVTGGTPEPGAPPPRDCGGPKSDVPTDVSEAEVVANPGVYTEDPGSFCRPFSNPERVLSEKAFAVVARVQQPDIGALPSVRTRVQHLLDLDLDAVLTARPSAATSLAGAAGGMRIMTAPSRDLLLDSLAEVRRPRRVIEPPEVADDVRLMPSGRTDLTAEHPVQWEDDIAQYQATTIALGHILEFRVRTRSNGYSLGHVAGTLTLAPRQTKRIQKIEFERVERARREESTTLADQVNDEVTRERDYSDTVAAYLSEWATGSSSSGSRAAAGGIGFAIPPVVGGVGGGMSKAWSESEQEGTRQTNASEQQRLRDAIRRHGDSLRRFQSTVVSEVTQSETVTGTTEVLRNPNYGHSLTVIYYQILRHLKVSTEFAGVRECLFVPFALKPFTLQRAYRWRESIQAYLRNQRFAESLRNLRDVITDFRFSNILPGTRAQQPLTYLRGSVFVTLGVERPQDTPDGKFNIVAWQSVSPFLETPPLGVWSRLVAQLEAARDAMFQRETAPSIAARWLNSLQLTGATGDLRADFTLATRYAFNQTVRVDFTVPVASLGNVKREHLATLRLKALRPLPPGSVARVGRASLRYGTPTFERGVEALAGQDDLVSPDTGAPDIGAQLDFPLDAWEVVDERRRMQNSAAELVEHLNEHVEFYHKAVWWSMDRDRLLMLLDGFYVPGTDRLSVASIVDREPVAIIGNSLVYRVGAGAFIGYGKVTTPAALYESYAGREPAMDPLLVSLPTDGLYAQTIMDECLALEEHAGTIDWVLSDPDPELGTLDPSLLASRRTDAAASVTPTPFPGTIINLQNAPDAPAPTGLQGVLSAVTNAGAFRDMAGLAGTQANAAAALQSAASLATNFGNQAAALKLAEIAKNAKATEDVSKQIAAVQKARDANLIPPEEAAAQTKRILSQMHEGGQAGDAEFLQQVGALAGGDKAVSASSTSDTGTRVVDIKPAVFGAGGGSGATATEPEVIDYGEISGPVDEDGNPIDTGDDAVSDVAYGGYDLRQGDADGARRWGGVVRNQADDMGNVPPQGADYVARLQRDLRRVGILLARESGTFDVATKWAVREFQIYAGMTRIAQLTQAALGANPPARYRDRLQGIDNPDPYLGAITGAVDAETRRQLALWTSFSYRIPVIVEAWRIANNQRTGATPVAENLWLHNQHPQTAPRMYVTDLSRHYDANDIETEVLGTYTAGPNGGGPNAVPPNHTLAEILPDTLIGAPLANLTAAQRSTFKVLRSVAEVECYGFFDGVNCWDDQTVSIPLHHGTLGTPGDSGELGALLAFFDNADAASYDTAFGRFGLEPLADVLGPGSRRHVAQVSLSTAAGGDTVDARAEFNYLKSWHWFYRWVMAGRRVPAYRRALYQFGKRRLRLLLETPWTNALHFDDGSGQRPALLGDVFTSERARALLLRWHVNMPGHVVSQGIVAQPIRTALQNARQATPAAFSGANVSAWSATNEDALVDGIMQARAATAGAPEASTMGHVRDWPSWAQGQNHYGYTLANTIGTLSTARGSMQLDP